MHHSPRQQYSSARSFPRAPAPPVGARVLLSPALSQSLGSEQQLLGSVRFSGKTSFSKGNWVGISLDEHLGKNDGSVQGRRYFRCAPGHGLFTRFEAVRVVELPPSPRSADPQQASTGSEDSWSPSWGTGTGLSDFRRGEDGSPGPAAENADWPLSAATALAERAGSSRTASRSSGGHRERPAPPPLRTAQCCDEQLSPSLSGTAAMRLTEVERRKCERLEEEVERLRAAASASSSPHSSNLEARLEAEERRRRDMQKALSATWGSLLRMRSHLEEQDAQYQWDRWEAPLRALVELEVRRTADSEERAGPQQQILEEVCCEGFAALQEGRKMEESARAELSAMHAQVMELRSRPPPGATSSWSTELSQARAEVRDLKASRKEARDELSEMKAWRRSSQQAEVAASRSKTEEDKLLRSELAELRRLRQERGDQQQVRAVSSTVQVTIVGSRGLMNLGRRPSEIYCCCGIRGKPSGGFRSQLMTSSFDPDPNTSGALTHYVPGDLLEFLVHELDAGQQEAELLAVGTLKSEVFLASGFEGTIRLQGVRRELPEAALMVRVSKPAPESGGSGGRWADGDSTSRPGRCNGEMPRAPPPMRRRRQEEGELRSCGSFLTLEESSGAGNAAMDQAAGGSRPVSPGTFSTNSLPRTRGAPASASQPPTPQAAPSVRQKPHSHGSWLGYGKRQGGKDEQEARDEYETSSGAWSPDMDSDEAVSKGPRGENGFLREATGGSRDSVAELSLQVDAMRKMYAAESLKLQAQVEQMQASAQGSRSPLASPAASDSGRATPGRQSLRASSAQLDGGLKQMPPVRSSSSGSNAAPSMAPRGTGTATPSTRWPNQPPQPTPASSRPAEDLASMPSLPAHPVNDAPPSRLSGVMPSPMGRGNLAGAFQEAVEASPRYGAEAAFGSSAPSSLPAATSGASALPPSAVGPSLPPMPPAAVTFSPGSSGARGSSPSSKRQLHHLASTAALGNSLSATLAEQAALPLLGAGTSRASTAASSTLSGEAERPSQLEVGRMPSMPAQPDVLMPGSSRISVTPAARLGSVLGRKSTSRTSLESPRSSNATQSEEDDGPSADASVNLAADDSLSEVARHETVKRIEEELSPDVSKLKGAADMAERRIEEELMPDASVLLPDADALRDKIPPPEPALTVATEEDGGEPQRELAPTASTSTIGGERPSTDVAPPDSPEVTPPDTPKLEQRVQPRLSKKLTYSNRDLGGGRWAIQRLSDNGQDESTQSEDECESGKRAKDGSWEPAEEPKRDRALTGEALKKQPTIANLMGPVGEKKGTTPPLTTPRDGTTPPAGSPRDGTPPQAAPQAAPQAPPQAASAAPAPKSGGRLAQFAVASGSGTLPVGTPPVGTPPQGSTPPASSPAPSPRPKATTEQPAPKPGPKHRPPHRGAPRRVFPGAAAPKKAAAGEEKAAAGEEESPEKAPEPPPDEAPAEEAAKASAPEEPDPPDAPTASEPAAAQAPEPPSPLQEAAAAEEEAPAALGPAVLKALDLALPPSEPAEPPAAPGDVFRKFGNWPPTPRQGEDGEG